MAFLRGRSRVFFLGFVLMSATYSGLARAGTTVEHLGADRYRVIFSVQAPPGTNRVHLAGSFNGWSTSATKMNRADAGRLFTVTLELDRGRYEYKYVLDSQRWLTDPENPIKAGAYENSVLFVGIEPPPGAASGGPATPEVNMAATVEHPPQIKQLVRSLEHLKGNAACKQAQVWLTDNRMPLVREDSVSFVWCEPSAEQAYLVIQGQGYWTSYEMPRLTVSAPVFGVSLRRADIPAGAVYCYELVARGSRRLVLDPYAWTVTSRAGEPVAPITAPDPKRGRIELLLEVKPTFSELQPRALYVYLPPGYDRAPERRYPVLYLHDGQNCWDDPQEPFGHGGWHVNVTADRLIAAGEIEPFIAVGIPNTAERMNEYGPGKDVFSSAEHAYLQYLLRDVKPTIDRRYRTQTGPESTAIMGSSMGGIISLQAGLLHPEVFGQAGCLSPALRFRDEAGQGYFELLARVGKVPVQIYLDSGTAGSNQDGAPDTRRLAQALRAAGWQEGDDLLHYEAQGAEHNERAWRARVDKVLTFLFGSE